MTFLKQQASLLFLFNADFLHPTGCPKAYTKREKTPLILVSSLFQVNNAYNSLPNIFNIHRKCTITSIILFLRGRWFLCFISTTVNDFSFASTPSMTVFGTSTSQKRKSSFSNYELCIIVITNCFHDKVKCRHNSRNEICPP